MPISITLSVSEGDLFWTGQVELENPADYQRIQVDDALTIRLGGADAAGETYGVIVDRKELSREGVHRPRLVVAVISPAARYATPRAKPIERTWDAPIMAHTAAEEAIGETIVWDMINWLISGRVRLAIHEGFPIEVVRTIAEAAGGVVESLPDGRLHTRKRFPVSPPDWGTATPDHVLTDIADNLSCRESHRSRLRVNRIVVRGYLPQGSPINIEPDARPAGLNRGRTEFYGGDTVHTLAYVDANVTNLALEASAGLIFPEGNHLVENEEIVTFSGTSMAAISKPAVAIVSVLWLGVTLGELNLESDNRTLTAEYAGTAVARVKYRSVAQAWGLITPKTAGGLEAYPVSLRISGQTKNGTGYGDSDIICQRGAGDYPGKDIAEPLLANSAEKIERGRSEIDAGEDLQEISLTCIYRPGIMPGQLVEVHDALMGDSWRGKVTSVTHEARLPRITTSLEVLRYAPSST
ncbi:MAG: hypothetical protein HQL66_00775 [Magnetococcales bacterium]|nr:hypothetical protein [Magnetococcales bacterium]